MDSENSEPLVMPLNLLREITDGFSEERKLGSGSYGKVYLGMHPNGENIAVKMLYDMPGLDDEQFQNEFKNLTRLRHQNIVRLVGYCHDIQEVQVQHEGKLVLAEKTHRALCLEYMSNGSLEKYISDECDRYNWLEGYRMIKGICQGLNYLHNELNPPIYHLDLKPANVLLDKNMVPRIADFGMSRLFGDEQTRATQSLLGTIGYLPPEYIKKNLVSSKFDIFSLGVVIIKIMAGRTGYFNSADMSSQEFTKLVQENWTNRLLETSNRRNAYSEQVKICIEIGLSCVQEDRHKRPTIQDIVDRLNETETKCTSAARKDWLLIFQEANRNTFPQYAQDRNDRHAQQTYHGSTFNQYAQDISATTHSNCVEENAGPGEVRLGDDSQFFSKLRHLADGDPLPGIERFQITGHPRLGFTLTACGFPTNGTTRGYFQWVRYLEDGTRRPIEGATRHDYVVTADDVGTLLAVDYTPVDDNYLQGDLVMQFANTESKITCDPGMQNDINIFISRGRANFVVFVLLGCYPDEWKKATLVLTRTGYQINFSHKDEAVIDENYSRSLQTEIPIGQTTQFVLVTSHWGSNVQFSTQGITGPNNEDNDVRLRDIIVLVMRTFQNMLLNPDGENPGPLIVGGDQPMHEAPVTRDFFITKAYPILPPRRDCIVLQYWYHGVEHSKPP
ncbi:hypothetical protein CFC21_026365 [Triticum aestivum]|uniref:Protein kinase domain-containing protein n=2 Tax=Triticum aestivum TaxID=4565 RepID=A0A3B6CG47_WHEAT|nr:cysteine-rich receptor-like protein kinase 6 isoform X1 [Triticum aestivum]KAF7012143.1 hypothetical protein CFC21_026365 [Triticum aestivum]